MDYGFLFLLDKQLWRLEGAASTCIQHPHDIYMGLVFIFSGYRLAFYRRVIEMEVF